MSAASDCISNRPCQLTVQLGRMVNTLNEMRIEDAESKSLIEEKYVQPLRVS